MPRLLHAADLHLSAAEKGYGLAVFAGLIEAARREGADYLAFCGDLFDAYPDAEALRPEIRRLLEGAPCEFLYLPGNHEALRRGGGGLSRLDLGPATLLSAAPFSLITRDRGGAAVEFLAIPHQESYSGYGSWSVPPKAARWRVALAHGLVAGLAYRGPDDEGGAAALDPDLFRRFGADYAALGHIHRARTESIGPVRFAYPGSARVWRRNEDGPRGAWLVDLPAGGGPLPPPKFIPLREAGEFRAYELCLSLAGEAPDLDKAAQAWGTADFVALRLAGVVEDENAVAALADRLRARYASRVRRIEIDRDDVSILPGIASQPLVRSFLEAWDRRRPAIDAGGADRETLVRDARPARETADWLRARELGLAALKAYLERAA